VERERVRERGDSESERKGDDKGVVVQERG